MHCHITLAACRILIIVFVGALAGSPARSEEPDEAILRALEKKISVDFKELPLSDVIHKLAADQGISAAFSLKALNDAGVRLDTPVTFKIKDATLRNVLKLILKELDLTWTVGEDTMVVTTVDEAGQYLTTKVHDVGDLLKAQAGGLDTTTIPLESFDTEPLIDLITSIIAPTTWDQVGGPGAIKSFNGMLVVSQTDTVHEQIDKLLSELRRVQAKREEGRKAEPHRAVAERTDPQALQLRIYRIGKRTQNIGLISTIPVVGSIEQPTQDRTAPLAQFGGGVRVPPIASAGPGAKVESDVMKELESIIPVMIEPQSWQTAGGQGAIRTLPVSDGSGTLLIRQTPAVHAQITHLLVRLNGGMRLSTALGGGKFF